MHLFSTSQSGSVPTSLPNIALAASPAQVDRISSVPIPVPGSRESMCGAYQVHDLSHSVLVARMENHLESCDYNEMKEMLLSALSAEEFSLFCDYIQTFEHLKNFNEIILHITEEPLITRGLWRKFVGRFASLAAIHDAMSEENIYIALLNFAEDAPFSLIQNYVEQEFSILDFPICLLEKLQSCLNSEEFSLPTGERINTLCDIFHLISHCEFPLDEGTKDSIQSRIEKYPCNPHGLQRLTLSIPYTSENVHHPIVKLLKEFSSLSSLCNVLLTSWINVTDPELKKHIGFFDFRTTSPYLESLVGRPEKYEREVKTVFSEDNFSSFSSTETYSRTSSSTHSTPRSLISSDPFSSDNSEISEDSPRKRRLSNADKVSEKTDRIVHCLKRSNSSNGNFGKIK